MPNVTGTEEPRQTQAVRRDALKSSEVLLRDASGLPMEEVREAVVGARYALNVDVSAKSSAPIYLVFALLAFVVALAFGLKSELRIDALSADLWSHFGHSHMSQVAGAFLCATLIAAIGKWLLASCSLNRTNVSNDIVSHKSLRRWPLCVLALTALLSIATGLNCTIDMSLISSDYSNPGFAQCDAGCDSCNLSLPNGVFEYGTVECLADVPCFVDVRTDESYAMRYATVNGSQASVLTVNTFNGYHTWCNAKFYSPANRGDFRFEANNTKSAVYETTFYALNSGVVDIGIYDDAEIYSMFVFASTAEELNVVLGNGSRYAAYYSFIQCPAAGNCVWQSDAQRLEDYHVYVKVFVFPGTDLRLLCAQNAQSCAGLFVQCNGTEETCGMQLADDWQCDGFLDLAHGNDSWHCPALHCVVDLSLIPSSSSNPGFAQCDDGCDSCNLSLPSGKFQYGTVQCLADVPCIVDVLTDSSYYAMKYVTVNGSQASTLTVNTANGYYTWSHATIHGSQVSALTVNTVNSDRSWSYATFYAPANRGDFRFEANNTRAAVCDTTFYALNSGVVDIGIYDDGIGDIWAEMGSMSVYASTADELNVVLGNGSRYAAHSDSFIQCPAAGKCKWQSDAQRLDDDVNVKVFVFPGTDLRLLCAQNAQSCAGLFVQCNGTEETCDIQLADDWQCEGSLNLDYDETEDSWQCPLRNSQSGERVGSGLFVSSILCLYFFYYL